MTPHPVIPTTGLEIKIQMGLNRIPVNIVYQFVSTLADYFTLFVKACHGGITSQRPP
jgi:hypothetical protein